MPSLLDSSASPMAICAPDLTFCNLCFDCRPGIDMPDHSTNVIFFRATNVIKIQN